MEKDVLLEAINSNPYFVVTHISKDDVDDISNFRVKVDKKNGKKRGFGLLVYLQRQAIYDEENGLTRTYLIRDKYTNELAGYFSLKTGLVTERTSLVTFNNITGIEIANLAVNESYREKYNNKKMTIKHLGSYFFSQFICPLVNEISKYVGVKYIYCFALPEKSLIDHYQNMGFVRVSRKSLERYIHGHIRPNYDRGCIFMYQEL